MKRLWIAPALLLAFAFAHCAAAQDAQKSAERLLRVFFIDVEGGQATLFVTPEGESLLIDTGWPDRDFRDADRIAAAAKYAGLKRIDYVLITHFHDDHVGGVPQLVQRIPVGTFIDHGENRELTPQVSAMYAAYQEVLSTGSYKHIVAKPGDVLPLKGMRVTVISADGNLLPAPLPGGGKPNPLCAGAANVPADTTENSRSLGVELTFGRLTVLDLGDLTADKEKQLMCPVNRLGHVDVLVVSHHGWYQSSSPVFIDAIRPRVAIMDNGETKGGSTPVLDTLRKAPGLEDLWQVHYSAEGGDAHNTDPKYIANLLGADNAKGIELLGRRDGSFAVVNDRTGETKTYAAPQ